MPDAGCSDGLAQAGFTEVRPSASVWCYATPGDRAWWGGMWADRIVSSALAEQAIAGGFATAIELQELSDGLAGVGGQSRTAGSRS